MSSPDPLARLTDARLADPDGIARTPEAIEAVWDEAEARTALVRCLQTLDESERRMT